MIKENDWFAINVLNQDKQLDTFDLVSENITPENTGFQSKDYYMNLKSVQDAFQKDGKFDEKAFNQMYDSCAYSYSNFAMDDYEKRLIDSIDRHPYYWTAPTEHVIDTSVTIDSSPDAYHRSMGLAGFNSVGKNQWSMRELAQANEATDENGNGLGYSPNDKSGLFKSIFLPTLALATYDENGYHTDENGNQVKHFKGQPKLRNGEFYYEKLGNRNGYDKDILRYTDTLTVEGSWLNKYDVFDADSVDKSAAGIIFRTALEILPYFTPARVPLGIAGAAMGVAESMPGILKSFDALFTNDTTDSFGKTMTAWENYLKRYSSTLTDHSKESFMTWEKFGQQIVDTAGQLYQQKFVGRLGQQLARGMGLKNSKVGQNMALAYMAATSSTDAYGQAKNAGASDRTAGAIALGTTLGFYTLMNNEYYKDILFSEDSFMNEDFVMRKTILNLGKHVEDTMAMEEASLLKPTQLQAQGYIHKIRDSFVKKGSAWLNNLGQKASAKAAAEGTSTIGKKAAETTVKASEKLAGKMAAGGVKAKTELENAGASYAMLMFNRSLNEGVEEVMEEAMQDLIKGASLFLESLGVKVTDDRHTKLDYGFSPTDFITRYITAGVGGFLGGAVFEGFEGWEFLQSPQMRRITSSSISDGVRLAYLLKEGHKDDVLNLIDKFEKKGLFGSTELTYHRTAYKDINGKTQWKFEAATDDKVNQNAAIAEALRQYINANYSIMNSWDLLRNDSELFEVLKIQYDENQKQLESQPDAIKKRLEKELEKLRKKGDNITTLENLYEQYNYSDLVISAMDKAGFFNDFYIDYAALSSRIIKAQSDFDSAKISFDDANKTLTSSEREAKWKETKEAKSFDEKMKSLRTELDDLLTGKKNIDYISRALYMAYDMINHRMIGKDNSTIAELQANPNIEDKLRFETSVENFVETKYKLNFNELSEDDKKMYQKEFDDFVKADIITKKKLSYDIFKKLMDDGNPAVKEYFENIVGKTYNPYFGQSVIGHDIDADIETLEKRLQEVEEEIAEFNPDNNTKLVYDSITSGWTEDEKELAKLAMRFGELESIEFVDSLGREDAYAAFDSSTGKLKFVRKKLTFDNSKPDDPGYYKKLFLHEAIGHKGLRQILNSAKTTLPLFSTKIETFLNEYAQLKTPDGKPLYNIDPTNDGYTQFLDMIQYLANGNNAITAKLESTAEKYGVFRSAIEAFIESKQNGTPLKDITIEINGTTVSSDYKVMEVEWNNAVKKARDNKSDNVIGYFNTNMNRYIMDEYLAELSEDLEDSTPDERTWLQKLWDFIQSLFGIDKASFNEATLKSWLKTLSEVKQSNTIASQQALIALIPEARIETKRKELYSGLRPELLDANSPEHNAVVELAYNEIQEDIDSTTLDHIDNHDAVKISATSIRHSLNDRLKSVECANVTDIFTLLATLTSKNYNHGPAYRLSDSNNFDTVKSRFVVMSDINQTFSESGVHNVAVNTQGLLEEEVITLMNWLRSSFKDVNFYTFSEMYEVFAAQNPENCAAYRTTDEGAAKYNDGVIDVEDANNAAVHNKLARKQLEIIDGSICENIEISLTVDGTEEIWAYYLAHTPAGLINANSTTQPILIPIDISDKTMQQSLLSKGYIMVDSNDDVVLFANKLFVDKLTSLNKLQSEKNVVITGQLNVNELAWFKEYINEKFEALDRTRTALQLQLKQTKQLINATANSAGSEQGLAWMQTLEDYFQTLITNCQNFTNANRTDEINDFYQTLGVFLFEDSDDYDFKTYFNNFLYACYPIIKQLYDYNQECKTNQYYSDNYRIWNVTKNRLNAVFCTFIQWWADATLTKISKIDKSKVNLENSGLTEDEFEQTIEQAKTFVNNVKTEALNFNSLKIQILLEENTALMELNTIVDDDRKNIVNLSSPSSDIVNSILTAFNEMDKLFKPDDSAISKLLNVLQVNAKDATMGLYDIIRRSVSDADAAAEAEDFALNVPGSKEILMNLKSLIQLLDTVIMASYDENGEYDFNFGWTLIGSLNDLRKREGLDPYFVITEESQLHQYVDNILEISNRVNYLLSICDAGAAKQVAIQNRTIKAGIGTVMYKLANTFQTGVTKQLPNVDIKTIWENSGTYAMTDANEDMSDSEFAKYFEQVKKFEHALYEAFQNDGWNDKSTEEKVNILSNLIVNKNIPFYTGSTNYDNIDLPQITMLTYLLSVITVDANDFYDRLDKSLTDKFPFFGQLMAFRMSDAFARDTDDLYNNLLTALDIDKHAPIKLSNVFSILGSGGSGKTRVYASVFSKMQDKKIFIGAKGDVNAETSPIKLLKQVTNASDERVLNIDKLLDEIYPEHNAPAESRPLSVVKDSEGDDSSVTLNADYELKPSTTYDSKFNEESIWLIDEATLYATDEWTALSRYAQQHNIKIIAIGDAKQQCKFVDTAEYTSTFIDLAMWSAPLLADSIRANNKAVQNTITALGKKMDNALRRLRIDAGTVEAFEKNPDFEQGATLWGKDLGTTFAGYAKSESDDDFKNRITKLQNEIIAKDPEGKHRTIAIITTDVDKYKAFNNLQDVIIITPEAVQGQEYNYCFVDCNLAKLDGSTDYIRWLRCYTILTRIKDGMLVRNLSGVNIHFELDKDGDQPTNVITEDGSTDFSVYNSFAKTLFSTSNAAATSNTEEESKPTEEVENPENLTTEQRNARRIILGKVANQIDSGTEDITYDTDVREALLSTIIPNLLNGSYTKASGIFTDTTNSIEYKCVILQLTDDACLGFATTDNLNIKFFDGVTSDGKLRFRDDLKNFDYLSKIKEVLPHYFDFSTLTTKIDTSSLNLTVDWNDVVEESVNLQVASTLVDIEGIEGNDRNSVKRIAIQERSIAKYNAARRNTNILNTNAFYEYLNSMKLSIDLTTGINISINGVEKNHKIKFRPTANLDQKRNAIRMISDLIRKNATYVNNNTDVSVSEINQNRWNYISSKLSDVFDQQTVQDIFNALFVNPKTYYIQTTTAKAGFVYLQIALNSGDMMYIPVNVIQNIYNLNTGFYQTQSNFNELFGLHQFTSFGKRRVPISQFRQMGINISPEVILAIDVNYNNALPTSTQAWFNTILNANNNNQADKAVKQTINFIINNLGKTMVAVNDASYLDMQDRSLNNLFKYTTDVTNGIYHDFYSYNQGEYGSQLMGTQKTVNLMQLYAFAWLWKYAYTGDPAYKIILSKFYGDAVNSQSDAIRILGKELGGDVSKLQIVTNQNKNKAVRENRKLLFETGANLINTQTNIALQTSIFATAALMKNGSLGSHLVQLQTFAENNYLNRINRKDASKSKFKEAGLWFTVKSDKAHVNNNNRVIDFALLYDKEQHTWSLYSVDNTNQYTYLNLLFKGGLALSESNLSTVFQKIYQICIEKEINIDFKQNSELINLINNLPLENSEKQRLIQNVNNGIYDPNSPNVDIMTALLMSGQLDMNVVTSEHKSQTKITAAGSHLRNYACQISDFFVDLYTKSFMADANGNYGLGLSPMFKIYESMFEQLQQDGPFRSGIYLESRSGAQYLNRGLWKRDVTPTMMNGNVEYTTDILHIILPICQTLFTPVSANIGNKINVAKLKINPNHSIGINPNEYETEEAYVDAVNEKIKKENEKSWTVIGYKYEDGTAKFGEILENRDNVLNYISREHLNGASINNSNYNDGTDNPEAGIILTIITDNYIKYFWFENNDWTTHDTSGINLAEVQAILKNSPCNTTDDFIENAMGKILDYFLNPERAGKNLYIRTIQKKFKELFAPDTNIDEETKQKAIERFREFIKQITEQNEINCK